MAETLGLQEQKKGDPEDHLNSFFQIHQYTHELRLGQGGGEETKGFRKVVLLQNPNSTDTRDSSSLYLESFLQQNSPAVNVQVFLHCSNGNAQFLLLGEDYAGN